MEKKSTIFKSKSQEGKEKSWFHLLHPSYWVIIMCHLQFPFVLLQQLASGFLFLSPTSYLGLPLENTADLSPSLHPWNISLSGVLCSSRFSKASPKITPTPNTVGWGKEEHKQQHEHPFMPKYRKSQPSN